MIVGETGSAHGCAFGHRGKKAFVKVAHLPAKTIRRDFARIAAPCYENGVFNPGERYFGSIIQEPQIQRGRLSPINVYERLPNLGDVKRHPFPERQTTINLHPEPPVS